MKLPQSYSGINTTGLTGIALMTLHITGFLIGWAWPILYVTLILSGIGQEVLKDLFKNDNVQLLADYFKSKNLLNKKIATYHAPAACIAGLLAEVIE